MHPFSIPIHAVKMWDCLPVCVHVACVGEVVLGDPEAEVGRREPDHAAHAARRPRDAARTVQ